MPDEAHQLPLRRAESAALFVLVFQAVAGGVALLLARVSASQAAETEAWHLLIGAFVWLGAFIHQRLRRLAEEEAHTAQALEAEPGRGPGSSLFESEAADLLSARTRLAQFEKYFLSVFSVLVFLALAGASYLLLRQILSTPRPAPVQEALMAGIVFIGIAFVAFLLAYYTAGLATQAPWRPVRPGANYSMSCALASVVVGIALFLCAFGFPIAEQVLAYVVPGFLGVMALDTLLNIILGIYRPRTAGQEFRPAHDSRLLGTLTTSGGVLRATAETLDYQFGFKVSETWFYRFMERAIAPLIFFQGVTLYLLTCFVIVDTGEQAIIERFGEPRQGRQTLGPGIHLKWPWPIEIARRVAVDRIDMLSIGEELDPNAAGYLWTEAHAREPFSLLVANRAEARAPEAPPAKEEPVAVSILSGGVYVYYTVRDLYDFLYTANDPKATLSALCTTELTRYASSSDFMEFLGPQRVEALHALQDSFQREADDQKLGIQIIGVSLQGIHPPVEVGDAFEDVVGATQEREASILDADGYRNEVVPLAQAKAAGLRFEAAAYKYRRETVSPAEAKRFTVRLESFRKAPKVFKQRELLSALEEALGECRKIIKPEWVHADEVIVLDLSDKVLPVMDIQEGTGP